MEMTVERLIAYINAQKGEFILEITPKEEDAVDDE